MDIYENINASGSYDVIATDIDGKRVPFMVNGKNVMAFHKGNVLTQLFFSGILGNLNGGANALNINYLATGSGTTVVAKSDTSMTTEYFRKQITASSITGTQFIAKTNLATTESNIQIKELGMFANATGTAGSGSIFSHANVDIQKTAAIQLLITFTLTIQ